MSQTEVQLIKDAVIVNADVSNSAAIDVSKISGALPAAEFAPLPTVIPFIVASADNDKEISEAIN